ncbi:MAG: lysophospholipase [Caldilineaceae bacterium]|nr:lysophospholipase [Caldilineaceae bacterium]
MTNPPHEQVTAGSDVIYREHVLATDDGLDLFAQAWFAAQPKAAIALVHGIAEHSSRYRYAAEFLARRGYTVYTFDLRGHGRSPGKRILFQHMDEHSADVAIFLAWAHQEAMGLPLFLFGHSMGGLLVTYYVLTQQPALAGVILSAPAIKLDDVSPLLLTVARLLAKVTPTLPMRQLEFAAISRDPVVLEENKNDALVHHGGIPVSTGLAMARAVDYVQQHMGEFSLPLLLLHGTADRMVTPEGSKQLYAQAATTDKQLKLYEGLYHELLNEPEKAEILEDIVAWLDARVRKFEA